MAPQVLLLADIGHALLWDQAFLAANLTAQAMDRFSSPAHADRSRATHFNRQLATQFRSLKASSHPCTQIWLCPEADVDQRLGLSHAYGSMRKSR